MKTTKQYFDDLVGKWVMVLTPANFQHEGYLVGWDEDGLMLGSVLNGPPTKHIQRGPGTAVMPARMRVPVPVPFQQMGK
jgi:hypothetical protein